MTLKGDLEIRVFIQDRVDLDGEDDSDVDFVGHRNRGRRRFIKMSECGPVN